MLRIPGMKNRESHHSISFLLGYQTVDIDFRKQNLSPTTTVLSYLRSLPDHKGVKEGCAEGDCGACTVVVAEPGRNGELVYKPVNSCLVFLPSIHGKQLITVEHLAHRNVNAVELHPVQQTLVEMNGSQCGYCTPGIVMSLFSLYKNSKVAERNTITDTMTGNLCRCTGYRSILNAAVAACTSDKNDHFSENIASVVTRLREIQARTGHIEIRQGKQMYFLPASLDHALTLREKHQDALTVNGSTDIALKQTKKFERLLTVIDLSAIDELKTILFKEREITIGAGLPLEEIKSAIAGKLPAFESMLSVFASRQIRNVATLGGNLGTASPIGDTLPLLMAYNAKVVLISKHGKRTMSIEEFIEGYRKTGLRQDELIHSVVIPVMNTHKIAYYKVSKRRDLDIASVSAGFALELENGKVTGITLAFGGMAEMTKRAGRTEAAILGKEWSLETIELAREILPGEFNPISDARCSADFRRTAAKNLLLKFYHDTLTDGFK
jgi:xanthine dehydrogenase small subunit